MGKILLYGVGAVALWELVLRKMVVNNEALQSTLKLDSASNTPSITEAPITNSFSNSSGYGALLMNSERQFGWTHPLM
jgi:hypothetical protein